MERNASIPENKFEFNFSHMGSMENFTGSVMLNQGTRVFQNNVVSGKLYDEKVDSKWLTAGVFQPENVVRIIWDLFSIVFIIYQAVQVPFVICFNIPLQGSIAILEHIITVFFMMDILITFNTAFYNRGLIVLNRKEIAKSYMKFWFWLDLISSFPYSWLSDGLFEDEPDEDGDQSNIQKAPQLLRMIKIFRFLRILRLIRLAKLKRILIQIEDYLASSVLATFFLFLRLLLVVFFIAHWTACWWFFIGDQDSSVEPITWITNADIQNKSTFEKYISSLYWAFTTMTTVGYGDILPKTDNEKLYAMFSMILACGVFAYSIGSIGSLVSKQYQAENTYREQIVAVNRYMKKKRLTGGLQFRVRRYLEYIWENKRKNNINEREILQLLSEPLRDEIYSIIHGDVLKSCGIFSQYETSFINPLSRTLQLETFGPGDNVLEEGEKSTKMYFIQSGIVTIFQQQTRSIYIELGVKKYFGEIAFFTGHPRTASAKCIDYVDLFSLERTNMNLLLEKFPIAKEKTEVIAKKCEEGDFSSLELKCYICRILGHVAAKCIKVKINPDHEDTKKQWLLNRGYKKTKLVPAVQRNNKRKMKKPIQLKLRAQNIKGKPYNLRQIFPDSQLNKKVMVYLNQPQVDTVDTKELQHDTQEDLNNSCQDLPHRRTTTLTQIFHESEEELEDFEQQNIPQFVFNPQIDEVHYEKVEQQQDDQLIKMFKVKKILQSSEQADISLKEISKELAQSSRWQQNVIKLLDYIYQIQNYTQGIGSKSPITINLQQANSIDLVSFYIQLLFNLIQLTLIELQTGNNVEISLTGWVQAIEKLTERNWNHCNEQVTSNTIKVVKSLGAMMFTTHPKMFLMLKSLQHTQSIALADWCCLMRKFLLISGGFYWNITLHFIQSQQLIEKLTEILSQLQSQDSVTLNFAKKMRTKRPGNSHQKRRTKLQILKSESYRLRETKHTTQVSQIELKYARPILKLLAAYIVTQPVELIDLRVLYRFNPLKLPEGLVESYLQCIVNYSLVTKENVVKAKRILEKTARVPQWLAISRFYNLALR